MFTLLGDGDGRHPLSPTPSSCTNWKCDERDGKLHNSTNLGKAVQVASIKTRVESAYAFSA